MTEDEILERLLKATENANFYEGKSNALEHEVEYLRGQVIALTENLMGKK